MENQTPAQRQVFISHASEDGRVAKAVCRELEKCGFSCWVSGRDCHGKFPRSIAAALNGCEAVLVLLSEETSNSDWVEDEVTLARKKRLPLAVLRLKDVAPRGGLEVLLATISYSDGFPGPVKRHIEKVVASLQEHVTPDPRQPPKSKIPGWLVATLLSLALLALGVFLYHHLAPPVRILEPKSGTIVPLPRGDDGEYRFEIRGSTTVVPEGKKLTVWLEPVLPKGAGWYLQYDLVTPAADGSWAARAQAGTVHGGHPPKDGDVFNVAAVLVTATEARTMRDGPKPVVRSTLPDGHKALAKNLEVTILR